MQELIKYLKEYKAYVDKWNATRPYSEWLTFNWEGFLRWLANL